MTTNKPNIYNMSSLDAEIRRLKARCRELEAELDNNMDALKENYGPMAFNSIIGNRLKSLPLLGSVAGALLGNPKTQAVIQAFFEKIFSRGSGIVEKWISRVFR
ncbi:MAG: hypothetical protein KF862_20565 [Chitinophagaceae bacterium]|nr:hypothetical protein [Chitinophagaceae bacterium]